MNLLTKKSNFLYLTMLSFVFVSSTSLAVSGQIEAPTQIINKLAINPTKEFPPNPVLASETSFPVLSAQGALAVDLKSGVPLYEKNADAPLLPASTTKIITALVALDYYPLDQVLTVGKGVRVDGQKMGLSIGEQMRVEDLLYGLLVYSANDAAETLAANYSGGRVAFVDAMNSKAKEVSMINSHFANPVGFDEDDQRSTARDLVRASEVAMRSPEFARIVSTKQIIITDVSGKKSYNLKNINELLGAIPGVIGVKTGWTENARENLVTNVERDGNKLMIVVLGSQDRFGETKELINWIFGSYEWQEVKSN
jgi:D-alanyl-D-alanine carboxypeptidase